MVKDSPQPQALLTLGFLKTNPVCMSVCWKSTTVPARKMALFGVDEDPGAVPLDDLVEPGGLGGPVHVVAEARAAAALDAEPQAAGRGALLAEQHLDARRRLLADLESVRVRHGLILTGPGPTGPA